jgi:hypothetical protein
MATIVIELTSEAALFADPDSNNGRLQNLLLNMIGGLTWTNLMEDEKQLCRDNGYDES